MDGRVVWGLGAPGWMIGSCCFWFVLLLEVLDWKEICFGV